MTEDGEEEEGAMVTSEGGKAPPYTSDASGDGNGVWMDVAVYDEPSPWATGDCMFDKVSTPMCACVGVCGCMRWCVCNSISSHIY